MRQALQFIFIIISLIYSTAAFGFDTQAFIDNFNSKNNQTVKVAAIDSLTIIRGPAEFHLSKGRLTLFDFGSGIPCAAVFDGDARFVYTPPDKTEEYQLQRLLGEKQVDWQVEKLTFFFTVYLDGLPGNIVFKQQPVADDTWAVLADAAGDAFDHFSAYMPNNLLNDLLSSRPGIYFYADIRKSKFDHLVFIEDQLSDDIYRLYKPYTAGGLDTYDVLSACSPNNSLVSERGVIPIDVTHYDIKSVIGRGGEMAVNCRIYFTPLDSDRRFLYWSWYYKNEPVSALDSAGDTLLIVNKNEEWGLGVVLKKPLQAGRADFIDIAFDCQAVKNYSGIYFVDGQTFWYPMPQPWDMATYDLSYECVDDYELISCGRQVESKIKAGQLKSRWTVKRPVKYVSFNLGVFETKDFILDSAPPVIVYLAKNFRHDEMTEYYVAKYGELSSANMLDWVGRDVSQSLQLFTEKLGPCPYDTIRVSEIPYGYGQGSPGLLHLTYYTFQFDDLIGSAEMFRAHEVSHQWFGHMVSFENQRDTWIDEGLAQYCGYMYFESIAPNKSRLKTIRENWSRDIIRGGERQVLSTDVTMSGIENYITVVSDGTKAGPITLGSRLDSEKSHDYQLLVYNKGAYVYHMIRYLMHDFKTGSDEAFWQFLRDLLASYKDRPITTQDLKTLLEKHLQTDMAWFFDQWVYGIDIPTYRFVYDTRETSGGKYEVICHVRQEDVPDNFQMMVPVTVIFDSGQYAHLKLWVDKPENEIKLPPLPLKPKSIDFNTYDAVLCRIK